MPTQKKKPHGANYALAGGVTALGGASIAAGEYSGKIYDQIADSYEGKKADHGQAEEHEKLANKYREWAGKSGPNYPYVTQAMREEAHRRAGEHRAKSFSTAARGGFMDKIGATVARNNAHEARFNGRVGGGALIGLGVLSAGSIAYQRHKFDEAKHKRDHGKFATTGVKKSMDIEKSFREDLHRRAHDGRFQAGASGAAGAGLAGIALTANGSKHHRSEADRLLREGQGHRVFGQAHADKANKLDGQTSTRFARMRSGHADDLKEAKRLHGIADGKFAEADAKEALAGRRLSQAASASRRGKTAAAVWLGAGAAGAGTALYNHHRQQKLVSDLEGTAVSKNIDVDTLFSAARGDEVSKALWDEAANVAGKTGEAFKTGFKRAGGGAAGAVRGTKGAAKSSFNAVKPKVEGAGNALKTRWDGQSQARKYTAVGAAGAAGGIGLGAAAQSRQNKPAY